MPQTTQGLTYPDSGGHTRLWEHFQTLAEGVDDLVIPTEHFTAVRTTQSKTPPSSPWDVDTFGTVEYESRHDSTGPTGITVGRDGLYLLGGACHIASSNNADRVAYEMKTSVNNSTDGNVLRMVFAGNTNQMSLPTCPRVLEAGASFGIMVTYFGVSGSLPPVTFARAWVYYLGPI